MVKVNDGVFVNAYEEFEEACAFADALAAQINGEKLIEAVKSVDEKNALKEHV